jgi:hypothetical protein
MSGQLIDFQTLLLIEKIFQEVVHQLHAGVEKRATKKKKSNCKEVVGKLSYSPSFSQCTVGAKD